MINIDLKRNTLDMILKLDIISMFFFFFKLKLVNLHETKFDFNFTQRLEELFAQQLEQEISCGIPTANQLPPDLCELPAHIPPSNYNRGSTRSSLSSVSAD